MRFLLRLGLTAFLLAVSVAGLAKADTAYTLLHQGIERHFILHLPASAPRGPRPLVVVLHGSGQLLPEVRDWLPIDPVADREGFVVAYPEAIAGRWSYWQGGGV